MPLRPGDRLKLRTFHVGNHRGKVTGEAITKLLKHGEAVLADGTRLLLFECVEIFNPKRKP